MSLYYTTLSYKRFQKKGLILLKWQITHIAANQDYLLHIQSDVFRNRIIAHLKLTFEAFGCLLLFSSSWLCRFGCSRQASKVRLNLSIPSTNYYFLKLM
jgi:hypothetical protein